MADRSRLKEIVSLSSFGIFLVVFGHSYSDLTIQGDSFVRLMYHIRDFIYSFHMPLFMFISGYLFIHTTQSKERIGYAGFIKKKTLRLIVPYLILSAVAFAEKSAFAPYAWKNTEVSFRTFLHGLIHPLSNMNIFFWFLPTIFVIFLAAPLLHKAVCRWKNMPLLALISAGLAALNIFNPFVDTPIFNLSGIARHFVYFWFGCVFYAYKPRATITVSVAVFAIAFSALVALNLLMKINGKSPHTMFAAAVCGIIASFSFIKIYAMQKFDCFASINGYSYQIYLLSWFYQTAARVIGREFLDFDFYTAFAVMLGAGLAGPVLTAKFIRRHMPKLGFIIGLQGKSSEAGLSFQPRKSTATALKHQPSH